MARQAVTLFLEDWLRTSISYNSSSNSNSRHAASSSAQVIIHAWAELRDCFQQSTFRSRHLDALKNLVSSQASIYVTDQQAKLLVSILSAPDISLPNDAYPLFVRLFYIWVRKLSKPSLSLIDSVMEVISRLLCDHFSAGKSASLFTEGVLFTGALSFVLSLSKNTRINCLQLLCKLLEEQYQLAGPVGGLSPDVLAGIGYGLLSSGDVHFARLLNFLLGNWTKVEVPYNIPQALLVLHLTEWVVFSLLSAGSVEKIKIFCIEVLENRKATYPSYAVLMATAGALRASSRRPKNGTMLDTVSRVKVSGETQLEVIASNLILNIDATRNDITDDTEVNFLLHCLSLAAARSGGLNTTKGPLLICLALTLMNEVFPLRKFYTQILESSQSNLESLNCIGAKKHQDSILFKEAGATTDVFCNLYSCASENDKCKVEGLVWDFCHETYMRHRRAALLLRGSTDHLLSDLENIGESAFLMVVVFALGVTKHRLTSKFSKKIQIDTSVKILVSFSCLENFRRILFPEYTEAIRNVAACIQDNESACVSFVESLPSYDDLTNPQGPDCLQKDNYLWFKDEVQTARIMFYLRVIPTCVSRLPTDVFRSVVAATMFLYIGHPNVKVALASHSVFSSFISSEKEADWDERILLKEQLVFYYMKRSLEEFPKITPFNGLASGVSALVRHLPAGSPSIYSCVHSLAEKANDLFREAMALEGNDWWKNWQGDSEPCKQILELLFLLISMVDIQVLSELLNLLARLIVQLPKDGQNMVLNELYALVAESDDVTRKQALVSWLRSLSEATYLEDDEPEHCRTMRAVSFIKLPIAELETNDDKCSDMIVGLIDKDFPVDTYHVPIEEGPFSDRGIQKLTRLWIGGTNVGFIVTKKIVGAKRFLDGRKRARDWRNSKGNEHGLFCAAVACGNYMTADYFGIREGILRGSAPKAKVALYQCDDNGVDDRINNLALRVAMNDAINDRVDVLSISLGHYSGPQEFGYKLSCIDEATLKAVFAGIISCVSAGNIDPPKKGKSHCVGEVDHAHPWQLCIGSCNTNKGLFTKITLGNDVIIRGHSANIFERTGLCPLMFNEDGYNSSESATGSSRGSSTYDPDKVRGKILFCFKFKMEDGNAAKAAGAKGIIFYSRRESSINNKFHPLPAAAVNEKEMTMIDSYWRRNKDSNPVAEIHPSSEDDENDENYPVLLNFSAKGPNPGALDIIKPDICAPGEMIVPLSSPMKAVGENGEERSSMCSLVSGTSFSTALVAGAMAFLKSIHPDWSPAALTSSVMTTADPMEITCDADMLGIGSGVLNVDKARNPGLVYDIEPLEHIHYLHGRKFDFDHLPAKYYATLIDIAKKDKTTIHPRDMNLPILGAAFLDHEKNWTFKRRLKNVGVPNSTYVCHVEKVDGLEIIPQPYELTFEKLKEVNGYEVQVSVVDWTKGRTYGFRTYVEWRCGDYQVRSYIVILRSSLIKPPEKKKKTAKPPAVVK